MAPEIDPAILRSLGVDSCSSCSIHPHGSSGFASTFRLSTPSTSFFIKTAPGPAAAAMFAGEHAGLNAIYAVVPSLCPRSFAWGKLDSCQRGEAEFFLATEFLDFAGRGSKGRRKGNGNSDGKGKRQTESGLRMSLAQKLAKLHTTLAPVPNGYERPMFGFPVTTCCGDTPQDNTFEASWAETFGRRRLLAVLERGERRNGKDAELRGVVERTVAQVVPRLLGDGHLGGQKGIMPVVVHGDLWSGNRGRAVFVSRGASNPDEGEDAVVEEVVFDPSACYAHHEYEQGIMQMFGGFGSAVMEEYHRLCPLTEPVDEYEDRVKLYESYHQLNHYAIFGGGYKRGAMNILRRLIAKYGD